MYSFSPLNFLMLLVFVQVVNCVTFGDVVRSFNAKADAMKVKLNSTLDFILNISEKATDIKNGNRTVYRRVEDKLKEQALGKIPRGMEIEGGDAKEFITGKISSINFMQSRKFTDLDEEIIAALNFDSPSEYDNEFREKPFEPLFNSWNNRTSEKSDVERVKKYLNVMLNQHKELEKKFDRTVEKIGTIKNEINRHVIPGLACYLKVLGRETDDSNAKSPVEDLPKKIKLTEKKQNDLSVKLYELKLIISRYNIQRVIWARFLIGAEKTPRDA